MPRLFFLSLSFRTVQDAVLKRIPHFLSL